MDARHTATHDLPGACLIFSALKLKGRSQDCLGALEQSGRPVRLACIHMVQASMKGVVLASSRIGL